MDERKIHHRISIFLNLGLYPAFGLLGIDAAQLILIGGGDALLLMARFVFDHLW